MEDRQGYLTLAAEIRQELENLRRIAGEIPATWEKRLSVPAEDRLAYVESVALKLHNLYTACERIFDHIAGEVNGALPRPPDWHLRLLRTMGIEVPEVRPRVLSDDLIGQLGDYLRFRHHVRNACGFKLDEDKLEHLVTIVDRVSSRFDQQIQTFVARKAGTNYLQLH